MMFNMNNINMSNNAKNTDKYKVALKFINNILTNTEKEKINDLIEFKDIDRDHIINDDNKQNFNVMMPELFEYFDKVKCGWYRRNTTKNYILTFLRYMCDDLDLQFTFEQKEIYELINGKNYRKTHTYYTIKNKI